MKKFVLILFMVFLIACGKTENNTESGNSTEDSRIEISNMLDQWHKAASEADYNGYFELMAAESVYIGTDAKENWTKKEFMKWSKPYFDRGKAWNFSTLKRNIYTEDIGKIAWFDELLETQMGIARGSGILIREGNSWKIKHYVLSLTIPNEKVDEVTVLKEMEREIIK
ncbi:MAG TPA: nuclear transport factor 2 family protein [Salinimicrobium sp.]|nr:nuclear transport factor 2 family protein [Salinimicrobium sp.]